jgi:hypothetical protein
MAKHSRLILTRDGERAFAHLADGIASGLDRVLRTEKIKKKELAERAKVDQAIVTRVLDGARNVEIRTVGALYGAAGYVLDVAPRPIRAPHGGSNEGVRAVVKLSTLGDRIASNTGNIADVGQNQIVSTSVLLSHD